MNSVLSMNGVSIGNTRIKSAFPRAAKMADAGAVARLGWGRKLGELALVKMGRDFRGGETGIIKLTRMATDLNNKIDDLPPAEQGMVLRGMVAGLESLNNIPRILSEAVLMDVPEDKAEKLRTALVDLAPVSQGFAMGKILTEYSLEEITQVLRIASARRFPGEELADFLGGAFTFLHLNESDNGKIVAAVTIDRSDDLPEVLKQTVVQMGEDEKRIINFLKEAVSECKSELKLAFSIQFLRDSKLPPAMIGKIVKRVINKSFGYSASPIKDFSIGFFEGYDAKANLDKTTQLLDELLLGFSSEVKKEIFQEIIRRFLKIEGEEATKIGEYVFRETTSASI